MLQSPLPQEEPNFIVKMLTDLPALPDTSWGWLPSSQLFPLWEDSHNGTGPEDHI